MKKTSVMHVLYLLVLAAWFCPAAYAGTANLEEVVSALQTPFQSEAAGNRIRDFEAAFTQEAYLSSLDQVQTASGRVTVQFTPCQGASARFRWEYQVPDPQLIVSDGKTVWVYSPDNRQVIESALPDEGQTGSENPLAFLTEVGNLSAQFAIRWGNPRQTPDGDYRLVLQPRQPSAYLEQLVLEVDDAVVAGEPGYPLSAATLFGAAGNKTTIRFSRPRLNLDPDPSLFRFEPPAGTEILRPEQQAFGP